MVNGGTLYCERMDRIWIVYGWMSVVSPYRTYNATKPDPDIEYKRYLANAAQHGYANINDDGDDVMSFGQRKNVLYNKF